MREPSSSRPSTGTVGGRSRASIEEELRALQGVTTANVEPASGDRLGRVRVTAAPGWPVERLRRDVEAVLLQRFDLHVPPRLLDVRPGHEVRDADAPATSVAATPGTDGSGHERLVLDTVHLALRAHGTSVGVDLLDDGERLRGTAGPVGPTGVLRGVVDATIDALRRRIEQDLETVVAEVVEAGEDRLAIATVTASDGRNRQRLTGCAIVRGNVEDAMARATLDATNRLVRS